MASENTELEQLRAAAETVLDHIALLIEPTMAGGTLADRLSFETGRLLGKYEQPAKSGQFRIWSNEHDSWWRPGAWGYTREIAEAGLFTPGETLRHLYGSACGSQPGHPGAVAVDATGLRFVLELQREANDA